MFLIELTLLVMAIGAIVMVIDHYRKPPVNDGLPVVLAILLTVAIMRLGDKLFG